MCDSVPFSYCHSHSRKRKNTYTMSRTEYTECRQAFFQVVRIGTHIPLTPKGVLLSPPLNPRRKTPSLAWGWGGGDPIPTKTDTLVLFYTTMLPVRFSSFIFLTPLVCRTMFTTSLSKISLSISNFFGRLSHIIELLRQS